jgi:hypothetical protein
MGCPVASAIILTNFIPPLAFVHMMNGSCVLCTPLDSKRTPERTMNVSTIIFVTNIFQIILDSKNRVV